MTPDRRQILLGLGLVAACSKRTLSGSAAASPAPAPRLAPPAKGPIRVAFVISEHAVVIDWAGPWEVFQDAAVGGQPGFELYTVAETLDPITASGGLQIVPNYTFDTAPPPHVIVIPAQHSRTSRLLDWIRTRTATTDVTMSVCSGAFVLGATGLLAGKRATTFHAAYDRFANQFPDVTLVRGARFVEDGNLASAGGLSSGIDLALRVVERYYGRGVAEQTAYNMEYQGEGWKDPASNARYANLAPPAGPACAVCGMAIDPKTAPSESYSGKTYYFCSSDDKAAFDQEPAKFAKKAR
jgi:transcriptional regulator GlxA family with amidase domain/YHS domain-containing protein